jgi:TRAP-type C4-dicarboxylate transport system substrate-binding protein
MIERNYSHLTNQATYDGLSDQAKAAVDSHCTSEWAATLATDWSAGEAAGKQRIIDEGGLLNTPSAAQLQGFLDGVEVVRGEWLAAAGEAGHDGQAAYDALMAAFAATPMSN